MVPFSLFFHHAYSVKPYLLHNRPRRVEGEGGEYGAITPVQYQGGLFNLKMWMSLFSIPDLIRGISTLRPQSFSYGEASNGERDELRNNDTFYYRRGWIEIPLNFQSRIKIIPIQANSSQHDKIYRSPLEFQICTHMAIFYSFLLSFFYFIF